MKLIFKDFTGEGFYQNDKGDFCDKNGELYGLETEANLRFMLKNQKAFEEHSAKIDLTVAKPYPGFPIEPCPKCGGSASHPWFRYPQCSLCNP